MSVVRGSRDWAVHSEEALWPFTPFDATRNKRIWALDVMVSADMLATRLDALCGDPQRPASPAREALAAGVRQHLTAARNATLRRDPLPGMMSNWWRGTLMEAAYLNLHAADLDAAPGKMTPVARPVRTPSTTREGRSRPPVPEPDPGTPGRNGTDEILADPLPSQR